VALDLGSPVLEQLVVARLLERRQELWTEQRARLRGQRDALAAALQDRLPDWRFRRPPGGLSIWCELPKDARAGAVALTAEAERQGVVVSPGPVFAADGGLDSFVRIPFTRPVPELHTAVDRLADAWAVVRGGPRRREERRTRVMVA
jgi:DNA-binding transcriptional MocR family regulator